MYLIHTYSPAPNRFILEIGFYEDFPFSPLRLRLPLTDQQSGQSGLKFLNLYDEGIQRWCRKSPRLLVWL
jgi:hypothetical protein